MVLLTVFIAGAIFAVARLMSGKQDFYDFCSNDGPSCREC